MSSGLINWSAVWEIFILIKRGTCACHSPTASVFGVFKLILMAFNIQVEVPETTVSFSLPLKRFISNPGYYRYKIVIEEELHFSMSESHQSFY